MGVSTTEIFKKTFKTKEGDVTVKLSDHSNWPPSGLGGITYYIIIIITGPKEVTLKLKYRDGNSSSLDDWSNYITSVESVSFENEVYTLQTDQGEKKF